MFRTMVSLDMRAPDFGAPLPDLYEAALDMCAFADEVGIECVSISEHHGAQDGYIPVPALLATAVAARTKRIAIMLGAIVLPLHDPVAVAETIAVADIISGGRLYAALVAGYVKSEFAMFGKSLHDRARLMDEGLEVISRALAGERFDYQGREVFVRPLPLSNPPKILVGGGVPAAARRAAKYGIGFWLFQADLSAATNPLVALYHEECRKLGKALGPAMATPPAVYVARDVDAAWEQIGPHVLHLVRSYADWASDDDTVTSPFYGLDSLDAIRNVGLINVMTPEQCVAFARRSPVSLTPLISGLAPDASWDMLKLFAEEVMPHI